MSLLAQLAECETRLQLEREMRTALANDSHGGKSEVQPGAAAAEQHCSVHQEVESRWRGTLLAMQHWHAAPV